MLFNMSYYFGISLFVIIIIVVFVYIWRKINQSELYSRILEKKLMNVKKENNELKTLLDKYNSNTISVQDAEDIMNDIFHQKPDENKCEIKQKIQSNEDVLINEIPEVVKITENNMTSEETDEAQENTEEIESIISENTKKYSKTSLLKMNVDKLKDICAEMNLSTNGNKNILIDRILFQ